MEEWQEAGVSVSERQGVLTMARCCLRGERKRYGCSGAQQGRSGGEASVYIHRRCATMKSGVRQIHFRQHQDQHNKKQQGHENEQIWRFYRPAPHSCRSVAPKLKTSTPQKCYMITMSDSSE
jgi:hypothetical protein